MKPLVYYSPVANLPTALPRLLELTSPWLGSIRGSRVGIKLHFGEEGNRSYIEPGWVRAIAKRVELARGLPVLIETSSLYRGRRQGARTHIELAYEHGFSYEAVGAPIQILDGDQGEAYEEVELNLPRVRWAKLARGLFEFKSLISLAHFKGHMITGFGGTLKNLGMGLAAKGGKLDQHSSSKPKIEREQCTRCGECLDRCPYGAIRVSDQARIDEEQCTGCAGCIAICHEGAIRVEWEDVAEVVSEKLVEYAFGAVQSQVGSYLNFLVKVTPNCDCHPTVEPPICPDFGVFASQDPVACDQACLDRVREPLRKIYPDIDFECQLAHAESIGLGRRDYQMVEL